MWNISKLLSALWGLLGVILLLALFLIYANFPESANLDFISPQTEFTFNRQRFFYIFIGLFLMVNLMIYLTIRTTLFLKKAAFQLHPNQQIRIAVALKFMACGANIFLFVLIVFIKSAIETGYAQNVWMKMALLFGPFLIVVGLVYLLFIMFNPVKHR